MTVQAIPPKARVVRSVERILLITGVILLSAYVGVRLYGVIVSRYVVAAFQQKAAAGFVSSHADSGPTRPAGVDTSLWSDKRIRAYNESLSHTFGAPLAVLSIPKIHLEVPLFEGTDDVTLDRGAGRIAGTAHPGQAGNLGIAGHRDGFFRGLKDVTTGDEIKLALPAGEATYVVDQITVVTPQDVSVLQPRPIPSITLVTCFPFYFVGSAPERYIVSASLRADTQPSVSRNARLNP
ncbi:MAG TPA: class D sortase [Edaphobacter sp.]|jgi:sortase A|nr:class D sortase [Edaphobacter sp.]